MRYTPKHTILNNMRHALTIDLEEYFQVHALSGTVSPKSWDSFPCFAEYNTKKILDALEEAGISATFFCLGWIAERNNGLIKAIHERGHEIACHGYMHQIISTQTPESFKDDVSRAKHVLEDCIGREVIGYRAPTYSITNKTLWALDILEELNFRYDSSIFPIHHDNYGIPDAPRFPHKIPGRSCGVPHFHHEVRCRQLPYIRGRLFQASSLFLYAVCPETSRKKLYSFHFLYPSMGAQRQNATGRGDIRLVSVQDICGDLRNLYEVL